MRRQAARRDQEALRAVVLGAALEAGAFTSPVRPGEPLSSVRGGVSYARPSPGAGIGGAGRGSANGMTGSSNSGLFGMGGISVGVWLDVEGRRFVTASSLAFSISANARLG